MNGRGPATSPERRLSRLRCNDLAAARAALRCASPAQWDSAALRTAWRNVHEAWLVAQAREVGLVPGSGFAIVATGSLGRRELLPHSDLDLLLLHDDMAPGAVAQVADQLWYPLWDANVRLDHSVRTVPQALQVADDDMLVALAMLDARHIAGDELLTSRLTAGVRRQWRQGFDSRYGELLDVTQARWQRSGEIADSPEPDLKGGRGGLRDVQLFDALTVAGVVEPPGPRRPSLRRCSLRGPYRTVLDVRTELHRVCGRGDDLLSARYTDEISAVLGIGDGHDLTSRLFDAAREISHRVDTALRVAADAISGRVTPAVRV